jgi:hypothetical protein
MIADKNTGDGQTGTMLREEQFDNYGRRPQPLQPKRFSVHAEGTAVRVVVIDYGKPGQGSQHSGSVRYDIYWAETVDTSTKATIAAGFARATCLAPSLPAPRVEDQATSMLLTDPKYLSGYYFCVGVDANGEKSEPTAPISVTTEGVDSTVPGDVTHWDVSESGEAANGSVYSALSYRCQAPHPLGSFGGVQIYLKNYPNIGQIEQGFFHRYYGSASGPITGKQLYPICRRRGTGTVTATNGSPTITGSGFLAIAQANDQVEILGVRATIQSLTDTTITLTGNWSGESVVAFGEYSIIGYVTIFGVAISKGGTHKADVETAPSVSLLMDGELSAPVAPTLSGSSLGNAIRIEVTVVPGVQIKQVNIYRATGAGQAFSSCALVKSIAYDAVNASGTLVWDDSDFTTYEKEQGQVFSYYATTVNVRDQESSASSRLEKACRLSIPGEGSPTIPAGALGKNLLYNSYIYGTSGASVSVADVVQSDYSGTPPDGYALWDDNPLGGASAATHLNGTEVSLGAPGAGVSCGIRQRIGAWDNTGGATGRECRRVDKGQNLTFSIYAKSTSATGPNGTLTLFIAMLNAAFAQIGSYNVKTRLSDDSFDYTDTTYIIAGSDLPDEHYRYYATFSPTTIPAGVHWIEARITHNDSDNGNNVLVTKVMLSYGDQMHAWTPELVSVIYPPPGSTPPGNGYDEDSDGGRTGRILTPAP